jgi:hypothetical protein
MREKRIKQLQKEVFEVRNFIDAKKEKIEIYSLVEIN